MRQLAEMMIEKDKRMHVGFVDLEKAYERVCIERSWQVGSFAEVWCVQWSIESGQVIVPRKRMRHA